MEFKKFIQKAFRDSGMKRGEFAEKIGVSRSMLNRYMSGESCPDFCRATKIVKDLGYKIEISIPMEEDEN
jgi:ribosome-binding protein aMBF1 (putative translation factor)